MSRLAEYLHELSTLLGNEANVHFDGLLKGSCKVRARIDEEEAPKVAARLQLVGKIDAPSDIEKPFVALNRLLREDNATGSLAQEGGAKIIKFPGKDIPVPQIIGPIKEAGVLEGELVRIGGKDKTVHMLLVDFSGHEYSLETTSREIAKQMAQRLYEVVRVTGTGTWRRGEEGKWELDKFIVQSFEPISNRTLVEAVYELRGIEGAEWLAMEDPQTTWRNLRKN